MIIADTCLIFHLFNKTPLTTIAQQVLDRDPHWVLPPLWREEYANVLSKLARKEKKDVDGVIAHFIRTVGELENCEVYVETQKALKISIEYKISAYDAHFIALAIDFNTLLITEDKEILKNCSSLASGLDEFLIS